jgi:uncharacterized glyoxalase superfamily protein PhnB
MMRMSKDGQLDFCTVTLNGAKLMLTRPPERTEARVQLPLSAREIYLEVENVDAYHSQVKKQGVEVTGPLTDQWWGDRTFTIMDPFGYQIWFYQTVGEVKPPAGAKIVVVIIFRQVVASVGNYSLCVEEDHGRRCTNLITPSDTRVGVASHRIANAEIFDSLSGTGC